MTQSSFAGRAGLLGLNRSNGRCSARQNNQLSYSRASAFRPVWLHSKQIVFVSANFTAGVVATADHAFKNRPFVPPALWTNLTASNPSGIVAGGLAYQDSVREFAVCVRVFEDANAKLTCIDLLDRRRRNGP